MTREEIVNDSDRALTVAGVPGRLTHRTRKDGGAPGTWFHQRWISEQRPIAGYGTGAYMTVEMRFDDDCSNGHNTFAITAEVRKPKARDIEAGGCMHEEIARVFPELADLIKWHLVSTDGPLHYIPNAIFWAEAHKGTGKYTKPEDQPKAAEHFASTVVWGPADDARNPGLLDGADIATIRKVLEARLPALLTAFRTDMERIGFAWSPEDFARAR